MKYKLWNNIIGWLIFFVAAYVYISTIEPTASFWDCGEFIATAYKLEVGHPPGAPLFMIVARFFALFAGSDVEKVAMCINLLSALASAFTVLFLFWTITHFVRKLINSSEEMTPASLIAVLASGYIGAVAYTFSDSFWFSAVEGEVYALSSLFTAVVFWSILKWENVSHKKYADRWLVFIALLMGLSIGIHLLNLLAIPAIVFVYYFKKFKVTRKGIILASLVAIVLLGLIMYGVIPGAVTMASYFELIFVNGFDAHYNTGVLIYAILLLSSLIGGIYFTSKTDTKYTGLNAFLFSATSILLGLPLVVKNFWLVFSIGGFI
ncbi:MAG: DUF2723 domain-containing protein, partial [Bacteroidia bacterium]|nr:DUF2723 domain-containing protein [Bacteroidia bacterium]